jgi:chemotaxis protein MotB
MAARGKGQARAAVIIRRDHAGGGDAAHHGGAWKVAYADFVTAMMAFFLLMWLINATTEQQRKGLADYFSDQNVTGRQFSGSGQPFGGQTPSDDGAMLSDRGAMQVIQGTSPTPPDTEDDRNRPYASPGTSAVDHGDTAQDGDGSGRTGPGHTGQATPRADQPSADKAADRAADAAAQAAAAQAAAAETKALEQAAQQLRDAVRADPTLAAVADQLKIEVTPDGLRVQLEDADRRPMFASGSSVLSDRAHALLQKVASVLVKMPEDVSISGHTDAAPYPGPDRTNWELSSDRANATRRLLTDQGVAAGRFRSVVGHADREPLVADDPLAPANRRIAILVHRQVPLPGAGGSQQRATPPTAAPVAPDAAPVGAPVTPALPTVLAPMLSGAPAGAAPAQR